jgi:hypothetical protein
MRQSWPVRSVIFRPSPQNNPALVPTANPAHKPPINPVTDRNGLEHAQELGLHFHRNASMAPGGTVKAAAGLIVVIDTCLTRCRSIDSGPLGFTVMALCSDSGSDLWLNKIDLATCKRICLTTGEY